MSLIRRLHVWVVDVFFLPARSMLTLPANNNGSGFDLCCNGNYSMDTIKILEGLITFLLSHRSSFFIRSLLLLFFTQSLLLPLSHLQRRHILLLSFTCLLTLFLRLFSSQMSFPPQTRSHLPFLLQQKKYASMKFQEETLEQ
jgi:phosphoglycerol transferase MdoB-like AlkP superfamily enzyme